MSANPVVQIVQENALSNFIKDHFKAMERYAKMHPVIAINQQAVYFDILADLMATGDTLTEKKQKIALSLRGGATRLNAIIVADVVKDLLAPVTNIFEGAIKALT